MRTVLAVTMFIGLGCSLGFGQAKVTPALQPSPFEAYVNQPTARITWSETVGRIESAEARAVITVMIVEDPTQTPTQMRGVRIDLERGGAQDQVYLDEAKLVAVRKAVEEIASGVDGYGKDRNPTPYRYYGAAEFWRPKEYVHTLNAAYYIAPESSGLSLGARKGEEFRFPDHSPAELAEVLRRAVGELERQ